MPNPTGGHYRGMNNVSNPYNQYPQQHPQFQPQNNYNAQNFGGHGGFPASQPNQQMNIFGGAGLQNGAQTAHFGASALQASGGTGLASHEAQMRFAHGAALQRQGDDIAGRGGGLSGRIREVWANNMEEEFHTIRSLVDKYPFISMDTEFPGIVARPMGDFATKADYHYQTLRCNVDLLKLIQLGITLWSPEGELPPANAETSASRGHQYNNLVMCPCTWTFNFNFSLEEDMSSAGSIEMLKKAGVDFAKCARMGIDPKMFGARLTDSGLVLNRKVTWLSFHSGYDFGYLVKVMFPDAMPKDDDAYLKFVKLWFGKIYDIKYLLRVTQNKIRNGTLNQLATDIINGLGTRSGLQDLADELGCHREGHQHTAGSDAWLTGAVFWAMRAKIFDGQVPDEHVNKIWGLSSGSTAASTAVSGSVLQTPGQGEQNLHTTITPSTHRPENPSTPQNTHTGLASTPGQHQNFQQGSSIGLTGGAFNFLYGNR